MKITPVQAPLKKKEKVVISNLRDKREKNKPKIKLGTSVRTADIKKDFSKADSTNWSYEIYKKNWGHTRHNSLISNELVTRHI